MSDSKKPAREAQTATVTMPVFRWHQLLSELQDHMAIANRDRRAARWLYEFIASELSDVPVRFVTGGG